MEKEMEQDELNNRLVDLIVQRKEQEAIACLSGENGLKPELDQYIQVAAAITTLSGYRNVDGAGIVSPLIMAVRFEMGALAQAMIDAGASPVWPDRTGALLEKELARHPNVQLRFVRRIARAARPVSRELAHVL